MAPFLKFQTWGFLKKLIFIQLVLPTTLRCDSLLQVKVFIVSIEYVLLYLDKTL